MGVTTKLAEREGGKRLFDMLRERDTLEALWLDRLGCNYRDMTDTIRMSIRRGVTITTFIIGMVFD